jgi:hypothetical protein
MHLPENWEPIVQQMLDNQRERADPKAECKEIRSMLRLMRDNFERGLYDGEEYQYWQKVNALKEKLELLNRIPEAAIDRAARTLLNLYDSWEWATREERKIDGLKPDAGRRYWIRDHGAEVDIVDIGEEMR